jgi:hypothetical protein
MESVYWIYRTRIDARDLAKGERLFLVCEGVDYQFLVKLNGVVEYAQEGMFTPFEIEMPRSSRLPAMAAVYIRDCFPLESGSRPIWRSVNRLISRALR